MGKNWMGIDVVNMEAVKRALQQLPKEARDEFSEETADLLIEKLGKEPGNKYVTRKKAYGKSFFTQRQRRWFFASLRDGKIGVPYRRTLTISQSWVKHGAGENVYLANQAEGAQWVIGPTQSRHEKLVGWKKYEDIVRQNIKLIETKAARKIAQVLHRIGWK